MSDHLPECDSAFTDLHTANCVCRCICPELRSCEQRVRDELFPLRWSRAEQLETARVNGWHAGWNAALQDGYAAGLDAAREAVAAECHHDDPNEWCIYVAAIDALREEQK